MTAEDGSELERASAREDISSLAPIVSRATDANQDGEDFTDTAGRPWQPELTRWLLTLNPGRTQDEYAKAVGYFFSAPGAPQRLELISTELLLAYRGALAMRAERALTSRRPRDAGRRSAARQEQLSSQIADARRLPGEGNPSEEPQPQRIGRLAPATVNIRLTALRQFLRFATMREPLTGLSVERIHFALRRLPIERRRPYQILSEEEWTEFLAIARAPLATPDASARPSTGSATPSEPPDSARAQASAPWGVTRARRAHLRAQSAASDARPDARVEPSDTVAESSHATRARDGRTGERTAQRDYALIALALTTGLRAIELSLLDVGDLAPDRRNGQVEWWLTLPDEKTKGQRGGRALPLAPDLITIVRAYVQSTGRSFGSHRDRATPLFLAFNTGPRLAGDDTDAPSDAQPARWRRLRPEQIRAVINRVETQWLAAHEESTAPHDDVADGRRISPHALRHSAAVALLKGSEATGRPPASVEHVRGWLGHFDIRTTQRYLDHLNSREERRRFTISADGASPRVGAAPARGDAPDLQGDAPSEGASEPTPG